MPGPAADDVVATVAELRRSASRLFLAGEYDAAKSALAEAAHIAQRCPGVPARAVALVHNDMGVLLKARGEYDEAIEHYRIAQSLFGEQDSTDTALIHHNLGGIHFAAGALAEAAWYARRGVEIRRRVCGPDDLAVVLDQGALVPILVGLGQYTEAEQLLDEIISRLCDLLGPEHYEVGVALHNLGGLLGKLGQWQRAFPHLQRAAQIKERVFGPDHPELVTTLSNLARTAQMLGQTDIAEVTGRRAAGIARRRLPPAHPMRRLLDERYPDAPAAPM